LVIFWVDFLESFFNGRALELDLWQVPFIIQTLGAKEIARSSRWMHLQSLVTVIRNMRSYTKIDEILAIVHYVETGHTI